MLPMRQPGIEIRPIHQITGESEFNEVFIEDARVPAENFIGELNAGWSVLQTALGTSAGSWAIWPAPPRTVRRPRAEKANVFLELAREAGWLSDPYILSRLPGSMR